MQTSQTLTDLANSARRNQDEFNNTLIEIHKQSANTIGVELTKILGDEMKEIKNDTKKQLSEIVYDMKQAKETMLNEMKPNIVERLWRGTTMIILAVGAVAGFFISYKIHNDQIAGYQVENNDLRSLNQELQKWQIPQDLRYEGAGDQTKSQPRYIILPKPTHSLSNDTKLYQIYSGEL